MSERTSDLPERLIFGCLALPGAAMLVLGIATVSPLALVGALVWLVALVGLLLVQRAMESTVPSPPPATPPATPDDA